jgi:hypothetical protein
VFAKGKRTVSLCVSGASYGEVSFEDDRLANLTSYGLLEHLAATGILFAAADLAAAFGDYSIDTTPFLVILCAARR